MKKAFVLGFIGLFFTPFVFSQAFEKGQQATLPIPNGAISVPFYAPKPISNESADPWSMALQIAAEIDTLDLSDSIPDNDMIYFAQKIKDRALQLENIIIQNKQRVEYARRILEADLKRAKTDDSMDKEALSQMKKQIRTLKKQEKQIGKSRAKAEKITSNAVEVSESSIEEIRKKLPKVRDEVVTLAQMMGRSRTWVESNLQEHLAEGAEEPMVQSPIDITVPVIVNRETSDIETSEFIKPERESDGVVAKPKKNKNKAGKEKKKKDPEPEVEVEEEIALVSKYEARDLEKTLEKTEMEATVDENNTAFVGSEGDGESQTYIERPVFTSDPSRYKPYDPKLDVLRNPPARPCALAINTIDEFSGKILKQTEEEELFRFTNDFMRPYLNGKPHILCKASMSQLGEVTTINLTFFIRDNNATKAFGGLRRNNIITLRFIDEDNRSTPNFKEENVITEEGGAVTVFKGQFPVDRSIIKQLENHELDKIRIQWNAGYEDYEIYNIDLLKQQVTCLQKAG